MQLIYVAGAPEEQYQQGLRISNYFQTYSRSRKIPQKPCYGIYKL